ncbi:hypothetical protein MMC13_007962 [Lambiella insularis]|nr:hypothetical protein [Lambiella insularis]
MPVQVNVEGRIATYLTLIELGKLDSTGEQSDLSSDEAELDEIDSDDVDSDGLEGDMLIAADEEAAKSLSQQHDFVGF